MGRCTGSAGEFHRGAARWVTAVRVRQFVANLADAALHPRSASSIRFGQVCFGAHSRSALTKALASSMNFRIAAINRVSASRHWDIAAAQSVMVSYYFEELQDGSSEITMVPKDLDERILNRDTVDFISAVYKLPLVQRQRIVELVHALALDGHS